MVEKDRRLFLTGDEERSFEALCASKNVNMSYLFSDDAIALHLLTSCRGTKRMVDLCERLTQRRWLGKLRDNLEMSDRKLFFLGKTAPT